MSHFPVAVFTLNGINDIDDLLAPYDERIVVEPYVRYTKEQLIKKEREFFQFVYDTSYTLWRANTQKYEASARNPEHIKFLETLPDLLKQTDEQFYQNAIEDYGADSIDPDGGVLSQYNPKSKWDWYITGGRWIGMLILKPGCKGERGEPGLQCRASENYDSALVADVDFEKMRLLNLSDLQPYDSAMASGMFTDAYNRTRFPTEEEYIARATSFYTYAVITPNGEWHAPGEMGWWAVSSETPDEERDWQLNYHERFIKPAIEKGWHITIVDCHI